MNKRLNLATAICLMLSTSAFAVDRNSPVLEKSIPLDCNTVHLRGEARLFTG